MSPLIGAAVLGAVALVAVSGCGAGDDEVQRTRVAAVAARPGDTDPRSWCDSYYAPASAPAYAPLAAEDARGPGLQPTPPTGRWLWMNFWATWCVPCRREMPLLEAWQDQLTQQGVGVDLWYLSVDDSRDELQRFLRQNPQAAPDPSSRLTAPDELAPWLQRWRTNAASGIPIHVLVDPQGRVRCVHVGATREGDFPFVKALLG